MSIERVCVSQPQLSSSFSSFRAVVVLPLPEGPEIRMTGFSSRWA